MTINRGGRGRGRWEKWFSEILGEFVVAGESALVGYTGFVGGNLHRQNRFDLLYNSKNIDEIRGKEFELLVLSATQAQRWWANLHPQEDRDGIERLLVSLETVKSQRVVLISTIDVLPLVPGADEDFDAHSQETHPYGANRLRLEDEITQRFSNVCIVRLPSLFGAGLKKNVIYDLLNLNQVEKINPASSFQYYDLSNIWHDITLALDKNIPKLHLFPEPVTSLEIIDCFFPGVEVGGNPGPASHYAFRTKYAELFGGSQGYLYLREEVIRRIGQFVDGYRRGEIR